jgi:predicted Zn-dependent protease
MKKATIVSTLLLSLLFLHKSHAFEILLDDEANSFFKELTEPIFKIAGLSDRKIKIQIIISSDINAFVADGENIFIYTGLISNMDDITSLIGVIAHESAHIKQGHILKSRREIGLAKKKALLSSILSMALGVAAQEPGVAIIGGVGSMDMINLAMLKFSRYHERSADKLAVSYLSKLGVEKSGMVDFFKKLEQKERIYNFKNSYKLTHPLSKERISYIESYDLPTAKNNSYPNKQLVNQFQLVKAKLYAITNSYQATIAKYNGNAEHDLYAQSLAYNKIKNYPDAFRAIDKLIKKNSVYQYFYSTKGGYLFEVGKIKESNQCYEKSLSIDSQMFITKLELANNFILQKKNLKRATGLLKEVLFVYKYFPSIWKKLGNAYYISGDYFNGNIAYAEGVILNNDKNLAEKFIARAKKYAKSKQQKEEVKQLEDKMSRLLKHTSEDD